MLQSLLIMIEAESNELLDDQALKNIANSLKDALQAETPLTSIVIEVEDLSEGGTHVFA